MYELVDYNDYTKIATKIIIIFLNRYSGSQCAEPFEFLVKMNPNPSKHPFRFRRKSCDLRQRILSYKLRNISYMHGDLYCNL